MRQPLEVVRDDQQSTEHESVFRANLADKDAVKRTAYGPTLLGLSGASRELGKGTHISVTRGGSSACWAVVVVTPIMRRAHNLKLAREIVFVDSTVSFDTTKCTVTVVLTATEAGAVPLAILIQKEQSNDGYLAAFELLKEAHPLCFGGQPLSKEVGTKL
ncbi:hypothetical protein MRX96_029634 [Rhipicephalus microplus]